jgi:hypothetical protein
VADHDRVDEVVLRRAFRPEDDIEGDVPAADAVLVDPLTGLAQVRDVQGARSCTCVQLGPQL